MFAAEQLLSGGLQQLSQDELWKQICDNYTTNEIAYINTLIPLITLNEAEHKRCQKRTTAWVNLIRHQQDSGLGIEPLLQEFRLDTREGLALMTLAEALIRIPDSLSADALIEDRLSSAQWQNQGKQPSTLWLNMSSWALSQAKQWYGRNDEQGEVIGQLVKRLGEPVLRTALQQAVMLLADRFVIGESIYDALDRSQEGFTQGYTFSFDMLGEAAICEEDALRYQRAYHSAIEATGKNESYPEGHQPPSISVKLSALHPRFEAFKQDAMLAQLEVSLNQLIQAARRYNVGITIDAEEADRLEPSLQLFKRLYQGSARGWGQLGLAVQAYSKRALPVLAWLNALAQRQNDNIPVRLVKGAYWDTEIKLAQQRGQSDYPVFTQKSATDISYLACARFLLGKQNHGLIPQFATHNAQTLSQLISFNSESNKLFECQRLYGMGESLYQQVRKEYPLSCRIYAPVGNHKDLLPYLVRRLLENGANRSFVSQIIDSTVTTATITESAIDQWQHNPMPGVPLPADLFSPRINSRGLNLQIQSQRQPLINALSNYTERLYFAAPLICGEPRLDDEADSIYSPQNNTLVVGEQYPANSKHVSQALEIVGQAIPAWQRQDVEVRARLLERFSEQLEEHAAELIYLCQQEAGKRLQDCLDELREAVDFCRYYALEARALMRPSDLPAITGESNQLCHAPRGLFVCISPWNFPLSIFIGQIAAALVTGNGVIAKPAHQTGLIAYRCCQLLLTAGVPPGIIALLPGPSDRFTDKLISDQRVQGVAFTGSTHTARYINKQLSRRDNCALAALIAETGGQNVMIVDSTALGEQVVNDAIYSAFGSSGQRCSALRVLFLQEEIADKFTDLLIGAMNQLNIGSPEQLATDIGPVIDKESKERLNHHIKRMKNDGRLIHQISIPEDLSLGNYVAPALIKLERIDQLNQEHFGPVLHIIRYAADQLIRTIDDINACQYGLTMSIHSRNETRISQISARAKVGNIYINRNQTGAMVGAQPFGGQGLSGTGPKAGGPNYLMRFVYEKTLTTNTTAWGGNVHLLTNTPDKTEAG